MAAQTMAVARQSSGVMMLFDEDLEEGNNSSELGRRIKTYNMIYTLHNKGYNSMQIAAATGTTISMVRKVLKKYEYMKYRPYERKVAADA